MADWSSLSLQNINTNLTELLLTFKPAPNMADFLFPIYETQKLKGDINIMDIGQFLRQRDLKRANLAPANEYNNTFTTHTYQQYKYGAKYMYSQDDLMVAQQLGGVFGQLAQQKTYALYTIFQQDRELRAYTAAASGATSSALSGNKWDNSGDVLLDIQTAGNRMRLGTGSGNAGIARYPNKMGFGRTVWNTIVRNSTYRAYLQAMFSVAILNETNKLDAFKMWTALPIEEIFIADMTTNTTVEGQTLNASTDMWGDEVFLGYIIPPGAYTGYTGAATFRSRMYVREYEDVVREGFAIEMNIYETTDVVHAPGLVMIPNVLT